MSRKLGNREAGQVSLMLAVLALTLLIAIGLVVDGGRYITAAQHADNAAAEAGRAAGQHITGEAVTGQAPTADDTHAVAAAEAYLDAAGVDGTATITAGEITITTTVERSPVLLTLAGVSEIVATGSATVHLTRG